MSIDTTSANIWTSGQITVGGSVSSSVDYSRDVDWYRVHFLAGHTYQINLGGRPSGSGTLRDTNIAGVYNSNGYRISGTSNDDFGNTTDSQVTFTPTADGEYYIAAGAFSSYTGSYTLRVSDTTVIDTPTTPTTPVTGTPQWIIGAYMDADNELEDALLADTNEMEAATWDPDKITLSVEMDRSGSYSTAGGNWSDTRRGILTHDTNAAHVASSLTSIGEANMGAQATLTSYVNYLTTAAPSAQSALILSDHGGGLNVCWDYTNNYDSLTVKEVAQAITSSTAGHVDLIAFDACLMASLDQAYALSSVNAADIMVASANEMPYSGLDYDTWITQFNASADQSATLMGQLMVTSYDAENVSNYATLSEIQLSGISGVTAAMHTLSDSISAANVSSATIKSAVNQSLRYDDQIDLVTFANRIKSLTYDSSIDTAADAVVSATNSAVLCETGYGSGLTIYMPTIANTSYLTGAGADLLNQTGFGSIMTSYWA